MAFFHLIVAFSALGALIQGNFAFAEEPAYVFGALGDSISAGFNALQFGDNRELSWTAGQDTLGLVHSHAKRIQNLIGDRKMEVINEAFVGATSIQLPRQANRLLKKIPDYVTIAIGANDICTWDDDYLDKLDGYKKSVSSVITRIIAANPKVKIVLVPVPSLRLMYDFGANQPGCQDKWDTMDVCRPLLAKDRTPEQREGVYARREHLNKTIANIASSYPNNVRLARAVADRAFDDSFISRLDCFHPSVKGHNVISDMSFDPSWY